MDYTPEHTKASLHSMACDGSDCNEQKKEMELWLRNSQEKLELTANFNK